MEITIRDFRSEDGSQIVDLMHDSYMTLKKSRGGMHPDETVDAMFRKDDTEMRMNAIRSSHITVAQVKETGLLVGMNSFSTDSLSRLIRSGYSKNLCVRESFQHGKAGVNVGKLIREELMRKARALGYRKLYGYSTPEAVGFHKKFGAEFFPRYDINISGKPFQVRYYEIKLRASIWNNVPIEPLLTPFFRLIASARAKAKAILGRQDAKCPDA